MYMYAWIECVVIHERKLNFKGCWPATSMNEQIGLNFGSAKRDLFFTLHVVHSYIFENCQTAAHWNKSITDVVTKEFWLLVYMCMYHLSWLCSIDDIKNTNHINI